MSSTLITNMMNTTQHEDWSAPCVPTIRTLEEWEKTYCGCTKCFHTGFFDGKKVPPFARCYKAMAYDDVLAQLAQERLSPTVKPGFKPASSAQIAEWKSWLDSPEATAAADRISATENQGKEWIDNWNRRESVKIKFNPVEMERRINEMWPDQRARFMIGPTYLAYMAYAKEQKSAKDDYVTKATNINTMADYDKAEHAYKTLLDHINRYGEIYETPKKIHKKPTESGPDAPKKVGRRAARKARNESEKSEAATKQYSRAELRALVRAHEGDASGDAESDDE